MAPYFLQITVTVIVFFSSILITNAQTMPPIVDNYHCYKEEVGTYDSLTSDYGTNIGKALAKLTSKASSTYYYTNTTGSGQDQVNALFSCRYDVSPQVCERCVTSASESITLRCFSSIEAIIWYEECTLHYANRSIASLGENIPMLYVYNTEKVYDNGEFSQLLSSTVTSLINNVTSGYHISSRYFGTIVAKYSSQKTIYALAQCNPDIKPSDCSTCLQSDFGNFTSDVSEVVSGKMFSPSCMLSYSLSSKTEKPSWSPTSSAGKQGRLLYANSIMASIFVVALSLMQLS